MKIGSVFFHKIRPSRLGKKPKAPLSNKVEWTLQHAVFALVDATSGLLWGVDEVGQLILAV